MNLPVGLTSIRMVRFAWKLRMKYIRLFREEGEPFYQFCPTCPKAVRLTSVRDAEYIERYSCVECRWKESESVAQPKRKRRRAA